MNINWEIIGGDPEDLKADVGEGNMLRVEIMDEGYYWWCVYFGNWDYHCWDDFGDSLEDAKERRTHKYLQLKYPL